MPAWCRIGSSIDGHEASRVDPMTRSLVAPSRTQRDRMRSCGVSATTAAAAVVAVTAVACMSVASAASCYGCSFAGECLSNGSCACAPGWRGPTCAELDAQTVPVGGGFRLDDYYVWGSQVVLDGGEYHMMASIYPKSVAGHSMTFNKEWLTDAAIAHAVATAPEGPFTLTGPLPLPYHNKSSGKPGYFWDRIAMNPKFLRAADGTWLLYYTGAGYGGPMPPDPAANLSWWTVQASQRIGLAHAPSPKGPWTRLPQPILEPRPGEWDSRMTTNVAVTALSNGTMVAVYKASSPVAGKQTRVCLGVATAPHWRGPYTRLRPDPILPCPVDSFDFEDPSLFYDARHGAFHLIVKDFKGTVTHAGYSGAHAVSTDALHWNFTSPALAYTTKHLWSDGKTRTQGRQERPELLLGGDGSPVAAYFATDTGPSGVADSEFWNMVVPLRPP